MPRRGENIHKRKDGRWEARYIKGYREDKTAYYGYLYARSYAQVKEKKAALLSEPNTQAPQSYDSEMLFEAAVDQWLRKQMRSVKQSTYASYVRQAQTHICPKLGKIKLSEISNSLLERFAQEKSNSGRLDGKGGLSSKTVRDLMSIVRQIIKFAAQNNYMPDKNIDIKIPKKSKNKIEIMSSFEQARLENCLKSENDFCRFGVYLCLYTGLRIGEICALRWNDISFDKGVLRVEHTMQRIANLSESGGAKTKIVIGTPKTDCSAREIPLPSFLLSKLKYFHNIASPTGYILTGDNRFIEPRSFYNKYKGYLKESGIGDYTFHCLRHTFATRCIEKGFDTKSLSEILGHSDVSVTLRLYVHPSLELKRTQMEKLALAY